MNVVRLIKGVQWMTRKEETFNTLITVKDAKIWLLTNVYPPILDVNVRVNFNHDKS